MRKTVLLLTSVAVALLLASGVGLLNTAMPAKATFAGQNGKIAYAHDSGLPRDFPDDYEIYTIEATGAAPSNVTDNNTYDYMPSYSPDGTMIAYECWDGADDSEICTIDARGGTPFQVTNNNTPDTTPSYSPDGTKIAYSGGDGTAPTADSEIYTIAVTGGTPFNVTNNNWTDSEPSYSPDGTKLAYAVYKDGPDDRSRDLDSEIYTINATGGTPVRLTHNGSEDRHPSWGLVRSSSSN
jgi:Tol biopolymer transport system component